MTDTTARSSTASPTTTIPTFYRMLLRGQITKGRAVGLAVLSGISLLLAAVSRSAGETEDAGVQVVAAYSLGLLVPLAALILATPMLGNLIEDRLLVYLWLKPVPRWHLAVAAFGAVVTVLVPVVVVPVVLSALLAGITGAVGWALLAAILGVLAYSAIYLFVGARLSWGLWLGLVYLVLWENILSSLGEGMARLSIRSYLLSLFNRGTDIEIELGGRAGWATIVIPLAVAAIGVALTARTLMSKDVD